MHVKLWGILYQIPREGSIRGIAPSVHERIDPFRPLQQRALQNRGTLSLRPRVFRQAPMAGSEDGVHFGELVETRAQLPIDSHLPLFHDRPVYDEFSCLVSGTTKHEDPRLRVTLRGVASEFGGKERIDAP